MQRISHIGGLLKKIYRIYSSKILSSLVDRGFTDLRASFLEVLIHLCEKEGDSIRDIGQALGLKKQTMTSHLNELEVRGYITRKMNPLDKREQNVYLTEYGHKFKFNLYECIGEIEQSMVDLIGDIELDRIEKALVNFHEKISHKSSRSQVLGRVHSLNLWDFSDTQL